MYIKLESGYFTHKKTRRLMALLGEQAPLYPIQLWSYCIVNQPDGDLSTYTNNEVAGIAGYMGDGDTFWSAMCQVGFIDPDTRKVHNAEEHFGWSIRHKERSRQGGLARQEQLRLKGISTHFSPTSASGSAQVEAPSAGGLSLGSPATSTQGSGTTKALTSALEREKERKKEIKTDSAREALVPVAEPVAESAKKEKTYHPHARTALFYLNEKSGRAYRETGPNLSIITARLKEPDVTIDGVQAMIDRMCAMWKGNPRMEEYLRPETLFGKQKFDGYYAGRNLPIPNESQNHHQSFNANRGTANERGNADYSGKVLRAPAQVQNVPGPATGADADPGAVFPEGNYL